jgi:hypothetical protein
VQLELQLEFLYDGPYLQVAWCKFVHLLPWSALIVDLVLWHLLLSLWLRMSCVSIVQDYCVSLHLQYEFISGLFQFEFRSFSAGVSPTKYTFVYTSSFWFNNQTRLHV